MKRLLALAGLVLGVCAPIGAQDITGGRVVVPWRNTSHQRVVNVTLTQGSITVRTHAGKEVIVETEGGSRRHADREERGMRRLDLPARGLEVEENDNVIDVRMRSGPPESLAITVPPDTSLNLKSTNGSISVEGVHGEIDANSNNGSVRLLNVSGTVLAHSLNGEITATINRIDQTKPLSFSTLNGTIDVSLPADAKGNVKFKADHGDIYSDFEITLTGTPATTERSGGRYRVRIDKTIQGTINGGGVEVSFFTLNGEIFLRKK